MRGKVLALLFGTVAAVAAPAHAQGIASFVSDTEALVRAVHDRDGAKATELIETRGASVLNGRSAKGETPLIVAVSRRDSSWTPFLLAKGANPNFSAKDGETPLIAAARIGFVDAAQWLLDRKARVDGTNRMGETPLIVAVQHRQADVVRLLMQKGADPDRTDGAAGLSARDYARRDPRARDILALLDSRGAAGDKKPPADLNSFKLD